MSSTAMPQPVGDLLCLGGLTVDGHQHRCGAPYKHGGPEHLCRDCGEWFRRDGGEPTA